MPFASKNKVGSSLISTCFNNPSSYARNFTFNECFQTGK
jgi:hypothetical protein